jgi:hypothetical protein
VKHPLFVCFLLTVGCSSARYSTEPGAPSLVMPAHFAEGKGEPSAAPPPAVAPAASASAAPAAGGAASTASPPALSPSNLPDPAALRMAEQVEYELWLEQGKLRVASVRAVKLPAPVVTPRRMGRYAIELGIGSELIERVRFDFPGTAADDPPSAAKKPLFSPLTLSERAIAHVTVRVPQSPRVRRALLVDRALNTATELEWPLPEVGKAAPATVTSVSAPAPAATPTPAAPAPVPAAPAPASATPAPASAAPAPVPVSPASAGPAPAGSGRPPQR